MVQPGNTNTATAEDEEDTDSATMIRNATADSRSDMATMRSQLGTMVINDDNDGTMKSG